MRRGRFVTITRLYERRETQVHIIHICREKQQEREPEI